MFEALKKTLLAGIGATVYTKEKVEAVLDELVKKGKISSEEAREMAEKIADDGRKEFDSVASRLEEAFDEMQRKANFATAKQLAALEARVALLEQQAAGDNS